MCLFNILHVLSKWQVIKCVVLTVSPHCLFFWQYSWLLSVWLKFLSIDVSGEYAVFFMWSEMTELFSGIYSLSFQNNHCNILETVYCVMTASNFGYEEFSPLGPQTQKRKKHHKFLGWSHCLHILSVYVVNRGLSINWSDYTL